MKLIVITHYRHVADEATKINGLFDAGLEILHFRKPKLLKTEFIQLLDKIKPEYYPKITIHEFFDLLLHYPTLTGVHLNTRYPIYRGEKKIKISKSCHTIEELDDIDGFEYVFLSAVFDSISKTGYRAKFTERELLKAMSEGKINKKVIALSGINENTLPLLDHYFWGGAAALGSIWEAGDPVENYLKLKALL